MPATSKVKPKSLVAGPSEAELRALLGRSFPLFRRLALRAPGVTGEWRCYKKGTAPLLKVIEGRNTLYYLRPEQGRVQVSFLLSREASEAALACGVSQRLREAVAAGQVFPEGRAVRLELNRLADAADVDALLALKLAAQRDARRA